MLVELVRTTTADGLRLDGALHASDDGNVRKKPAVLVLHGVGGNFYSSSTFEPLLPKLHAAGYPTLTVNTRGHDSVFGAQLGNIRRRLGAAYEIVDECRADIAAWIKLLVSRGHQRVILLGHSLGAIKAVYAQAHDRHASVAAVLAVSPPRLSFTAFNNAAESSVFFESMSIARELVKEGSDDELFDARFPFPLLITAASYIDKYGPAERYNILEFTQLLRCPTLFTYGSKELAQGGIAFAGLPEAINKIPAHAARDVITIPDADHFYTGVQKLLADRVGEWLTQQGID
ncbi:Alpha/beta hydrolase family protein [Anatilimnocola aggregata]|uniref:Alpha/beta hydrolase family protein n=1 Tax=Anatilimnocola aggregata TaxID=2528021 RepID=A0A517YB07_9BACT|nr:alpha/beta fold hydrolase [Anatilimnocola aggregata]QDU27418.1 Alpha/beta hydrolase family protein [Anatilimnocola aggregata]